MTVAYYVSPNGDDDWSGEDPAPTDANGPLRTIAEARDRIQKRLAGGLDRNVRVVLREGDYYRLKPLHFGKQDSGRDGYTITYENYTGECPRLIGGVPLTDWTPVDEADGDVYMADLPAELSRTPDTLYENGVHAEKARYPDEGYLEVDEADSEEPKRAFRYEPGELPDIEEQTDLQVFIWPGGPQGHHAWFSNTLDASVEADGRTVKLSQEANYELGGGSRYYLQGPRELLTRPGEFYVDADAHTVYYWPRTAPIEDSEIIVPAVDRVLEIVGDGPHSPAGDLRFDGLEIYGSNVPHQHGGSSGEAHHGAVYTRNVDGVELSNAHIHGTGYHGVLLHEATRNAAVTGCHIHDVGYTGVRLAGGETRKYRHRNNEIADTHVHHTGKLVGHGAGIQMRWNSGNNEIAHNRVHHTPRYAISLKGHRPGSLNGETVEGVEVTDATAREFIHTRNNVVAYNDVSHANLESQDTGVIESWGAGTGNVLEGNRIHDSQIHFSFGFGLYLDDAADGFHVSHNLIHDLSACGDGTLRFGIYSKGVNNHFQNNVVADNDAGGAYGSFEMAGELAREHVLHRNVFADTGPILYGFQNWSEDRIRAADHNHFYHPDSEYTLEGVPSNYAIDGDSYEVEDLEEWRSFLDGQFDVHSTTGEPQFLDPEQGDYRLRYDSPAREVGARSVDVAAIGLTENFPYDDVSDSLAAVFVTGGEQAAEPFSELATSETVSLEVTARSETGFVLDTDAPDVAVSFESDTPDVATVDDEGTVTAGEAGVAEILAQVSAREEAQIGRYHVLVTN